MLWYGDCLRMMMQGKKIYTIGHSNRPLEVFLSMLQSFQIGLVADIRRLPGSRKYPHFDKENLEASLAQHNIQYQHFENLGGRRRPEKNSRNTGWRQTAFRGYADYMESEDFLQAVRELEVKATGISTAYMCSEAVWWSCHRALVSDYLKLHGWEVLHIMDTGKVKEHPFTSPAIIKDGVLSYEAGE